MGSHWLSFHTANSARIRTWPQFARRVRAQGCRLLSELERFPNAVLVTGCQRSGTTVMARIITNSDGMVNYWSGPDDELDAALILSGTVAHANCGRYCFQTTYLNECFHEYLDRVRDQKIIWVLRNPMSVTSSMLYHWGRFAFNELFDACGAQLMSEGERQRYTRFGRLSMSRIQRACLAYNGKINQLFSLAGHFSTSALAVIDYEDLITGRHRLLKQVYTFIDLPYRDTYAQALRSGTKSRSRQLSDRQRRVVQRSCMPTYQRAGGLIHFIRPHEAPAPAGRA